jgi:flagellar biosynthesis anti-sigma factor FlgM
MRIDPNQRLQPLPEIERRRRESPAAADRTSVSKASAGENPTELSGPRAQVQELAKQVTQLPEVRQERVHALQQTIDSGLYRPGLDQVAGALLEHMMWGPAA